MSRVCVEEKIAQRLGHVEMDDDAVADNLAIVLVMYFESHPDCPDEEADHDTGWKPWAVQQTNDALARIAAEAVRAIP